MVADLVDRIAGQALRELAALLLQQQVHQALRPRLALLRVALAHQHLDEVGGLRVAAPALAPGDHPLVAVQHGAGGDAGEVGAGVGLRQRDRADPLTARAAGEQLVPPLVVGDRRPQALRAGQDAGRRHPGAGQLLADHAVLEDAEPQAAVLGRHGDAEVAELGQPVQQGRRDLALLRVELVGDRQHLVHREPAGLLLQLLPLRGVPRGQQHRAARGCQVSFSVDVIVGGLSSARADDHVHLDGWACPPHAVVIRPGEQRHALDIPRS